MVCSSQTRELFNIQAGNQTIPTQVTPAQIGCVDENCISLVVLIRGSKQSRCGARVYRVH